MKKETRFARAAAVALALGAAAMAANADDAVIRLKNTLGFDRMGELVEVPVPEGSDLQGMTLVAPGGKAVAYEATDHGTIRFMADVPQGAIAEYRLTGGSAIQPSKLTYAAIKAPGSRDDAAWENNLAAYRVYSHTLLGAEPSTGNGVDLWQKKVDEPIIDYMYAQSNYHSENAYGVDAYSVNGLRLGAGAVSHITGGKIAVHKPYDRCEILENGLYSSTLRLVYEGVEVDGDSYTKTVTITTSANGLLNKAVVVYDGPAKPIKLGVALYMHTDMGGDHRTATYTSVPGLIGLAEQPSEGTVTSAGARFYLGAYLPGGDTETAVLNDHLVVMTDYMPGTELTYYFGGGWNVHPEDCYPTDDDWFDALNRFRKAADSPLAETSATSVPNREDVITLLHNVNRHWIDTHSYQESHFWDKAVYYTGLMEAYKATGEEDYRQYAENWAEYNNWCGATGTNPDKWKYSYGEGGDYVLFGDNQICFQVYCDLYKLDPQDYKIARAIEVMEYQMATENIDYWWWVDGLYMVMPVMTKLYNITGNELYLEKMHQYWAYATELMYDPEERLYYRDGGYVFPGWSIKVGDDPTPRKDFWARGCGWIFAAFARVLDELPADAPYRDEYLAIYRDMAAALKDAQQPEGHWTRSVLEPDYATGYETSGTALFLYGYLWGINHGIFSDKEYGSVVEKAWRYLTEIALQDGNTIGYVQPIGSKAEPGVVIAPGQTANFGTGAFLLAASQMIDYAAGDADITALRLSVVRLDGSNRIVAVFNEAPEAAEADKAEHYLLNGSPIEAEIAYDGNRTVTFTFAQPLAYGRYTFDVQGIASALGGQLAANQQRMLVCTVPLTPSPEGVTVTAIGNQSGNPAANTIDNNMGTRWSQAGLRQWICYDLGAVRKVKGVDVAFYAGSQRKSYFDIEVSEDGSEFATVLEGCETSGLTDEMERYGFSSCQARYVRLMCNGNSQGGDNWNSITECRIVLDIDADDMGEIEGLPTVAYYDFIMPSATTAGMPITWMSSQPEILSETGLVKSGDADCTVTLTAYYGDASKEFDVIVAARDAEKALHIRYDFEAQQLLEGGLVADLSGHGLDARVMGNALINGALDLSGNTAAAFADNGYLIVPEGALDSLRSYTFMADVMPMALAHQPRIYDFGSGSGNSLFLRASGFAAGFKYNNGTTALVNAQPALATGVMQRVAVTFDAATHTTTVYLDGQQAAQSAAIAYEPWQLRRIAADARNYIGRTQWWDSGVKGDNIDFQGTIDNFRLYRTALSAEELAAAYSDMDGLSAAEALGASISGYALHRGDVLRVQCERGSHVSVHSVSGMAVASITAAADGCDVRADFAPGIYIVRVQSQGGASVFKIVVR